MMLVQALKLSSKPFCMTRSLGVKYFRLLASSSYFMITVETHAPDCLHLLDSSDDNIAFGFSVIADAFHTIHLC